MNGEILIEKNKRNKVIVKSPVILGYDSFINNKTYPNTSITLTQSNIFYISRTKYHEEISHNNEFLSIFRNI